MPTDTGRESDSRTTTDASDRAYTATEQADEQRPAADTVRLWLVERTYSDDEQNIVILVYATPDGTRYFRKERALVSFSDHRETTAAIDADPESLGVVDDEETRERYATEAQRIRSRHDPDDAL